MDFFAGIITVAPSLAFTESGTSALPGVLAFSGTEPVLGLIDIAINHEKEISSIIVEGGAQTLNTFINENIWDEIKVFKSNKRLGNGINAPEIKLLSNNEEKIKGDTLITYLNE